MAIATIYSSTADGGLYHGGVVYLDVWNAAEADGYPDDFQEDSAIGQWLESAYAIWRSCFFFDTSSIPIGVTIVSAKLCLRGEADLSDTDFLLTIQNGQPIYPHKPMVIGDYNRTNYSGDGGSLSTAGFTVVGYNEIPLNETGISWINKGGWTKLCVRSSREITGVTPTGKESIVVYNTEAGGDFRPKLVLEYTVVIPTVTTQAATLIEATSCTGNGNITAAGGENCTRRGFCYKVGTSGTPTTADSVAYDDGSFGVGAYTKAITGLTAGTSYRVRAYAVNSAGIGYGTTVQITTDVSDTFQLKWNVKRAISDTNQMKWNVRKAIADIAQFVWNVKVGFSWKIGFHAAVSQRRYKSAAFPAFTFPDPAGSGFTSANDGYYMLAGWGKSIPALVLFWKVGGAISDTIQTVWRVLTTVPGSTSQYIWNVRKAISDTSQYIWNVRFALSDTVQVVWNAGKATFNTVQTVWRVLTIVPGSELQAIWNVKFALSDTVQTIWNVKKALSDTIQLIWDVGGYVGKTIKFLWNVYFIGAHFVPPGIYQIEVHDTAGNLIAILEKAYKISLEETLNVPKTLTFSNPADDTKLSYITRANEIWVRDVKNNVVLAKVRLLRSDDTR